MQRATRWFKALFSKKKSRQYSAEDKENTRWSSSYYGLCYNPTTITPSEAAWLRSFYAGADDERSQHAIAVAAATAAAADAAVAAAQAAAAVVRLTTQGSGGASREKWAAVKIQSLFRGFLARKAIRALRGLVKIQALVRGFLVRKQAAATLHSIQALIRVQSAIRARRCHAQQEKESDVDVDVESRSSRRLSSPLETSPKIVEIDTGGFRSKSNPSPHPEEWGEVEYGYCTAQSTPRFSTALGSNVCTETYFGENPNYMAKTQSFKAKVRSQSAPKQRPESYSCIKRRVSLREVMVESRSSLCGMRMQSSCSGAQDTIIFKNAVMGKIGKSSFPT